NLTYCVFRPILSRYRLLGVAQRYRRVADTAQAISAKHLFRRSIAVDDMISGQANLRRKVLLNTRAKCLHNRDGVSILSLPNAANLCTVSKKHYKPLALGGNI